MFTQLQTKCSQWREAENGDSKKCEKNTDSFQLDILWMPLKNVIFCFLLEFIVLKLFSMCVFQMKYCPWAQTVLSIRIESFFQFRFSYFWTMNTSRSFVQYLAVNRYCSWEPFQISFLTFQSSASLYHYILHLGFYWSIILHITYSKPKYMPRICPRIIKEKPTWRKITWKGGETYI